MGFTYVFHDTSNGEYKIGATTQGVAERLNELKTGNPNLDRFRHFETNYPFDLERKLINTFKTKKTRRDFFALSGDNLLALDRIVSEAEASLPLETSILVLRNRQDNGILLDPTDAYRQDVAELRRVKDEISLLEVRKDELEARLKTTIGICRGIRGLINWTTNEKPTPWFDRKQFKEDEPDMHAAYLRFRFQRMFRLLA